MQLTFGRSTDIFAMANGGESESDVATKQPMRCKACNQACWCCQLRKSIRRLKYWKPRKKEERIFRRMSSGLVGPAPIPEHVLPLLKNVRSWDFDIFKLNVGSENNAIRYVGFEVFNYYGLSQRYKIPHSILDRFLMKLQVGYSKHNNPYHNLIHGADVTQSCHWMISQTGLLEVLTDIEILSCIFAALIHDYEHTGHTNNFHVQSGSDFALMYNDRSVLENHHLSTAFRILKEADKNILAFLSREEYREFRNLVIEIVLATDMSTHFVQVKAMKNALSLPETIDHTKALSLLVHCCDIAHPAKTWNLHYRWTLNVTEEFFRQGDLEASMGLPYSPLCDRDSVHVAESQIGFIDFIVEPSMMVCGEMLIKMIEPLVTMPSDDHSMHNGHDSSLDSARSNVSMKSGLRIPLTSEGKLNIPQPWIQIMEQNKTKWKEQSSKDNEKKN